MNLQDQGTTETQGGPQPTDGPKILIVDDSRPLRHVLRNWIKSTFPDHVILEAESGEEAIDLAGQWQPALILMDIGLPKINGLEATRLIKQEKSPKSKIVIVTLYEGPHYQTLATDAGADGFVPKSRLLTHLIPTLQDLLGDNGKETPS
ncbi:MAG: response regulator transcription factor [Chloroflexi bacterium]|nr:response regulator transcription factor [Chloroflexota bacterium]MCI0576718.1 response regulator transcription factor [Chloroflexota bacterium]MCI0645530.1 response regulator transcription factor [Chloroflexota bacterium]